MMLKSTLFIALFSLASTSALPATVAIYADVRGNNPVGELLRRSGHTVKYVSSREIAGGQANGYDVFLYTRNFGGNGTKLGSNEAAEIKANYAKSTTLFFTDLTDSLVLDGTDGKVNAEQMFLNAVEEGAKSGGAFIGEFVGAAWAVENNLVAGINGGLDKGTGQQVTVVPTSPIMSGISKSFNSSQSDNFLYRTQNLNEKNVLARDSSGNVTVYSTYAAAPVPEPASLAMLGMGACALCRRKR